jgi:hypothetical protein
VYKDDKHNQDLWIAKTRSLNGGGWGCVFTRHVEQPSKIREAEDSRVQINDRNRPLVCASETECRG